ncbi:2-succinyl-5-enolpyruvyl-6-hydroxy-3-cyclohexene-1-carboxylic-acid synthase [Leptolyngbya cf. ectocarpi LEGE 11479]|uniref:2-succinyl-5-enolpyruvyl-6-hydroxy-3-cyclohexene-1-carboxylate synthase n=1 Tax=Leptolyngbya cf. ectocarpi LEGE 11479 TaxID=1828722 RepID=A0A929F9H1_LEPEC|nr:2-succinyl-5-enolpyruvyl-6-hydroxy-3-cyclohexene-1-carboxylic-acid synthase [Leptolyngbya ectocarpi]MBE9067867.1 2-succinyl-5-enolpyruvyl-6-hydroxy-3-cyclohexene-1-carboxylic-acid synthase [Leptolyngbya cf. ectocarpi LEGE 11479]
MGTLLDYRNTNTLWASVIAETLHRLGLSTAVICPGSRSTPLTVALVRHPHIKTIPILDERSAAFFALGCAKRLHEPVAIVCTSGTAGANFYPAVIEAQESHVPLLIFTADRPPELRACASGQTIDQQKLFSGFVNWYTEMAVPTADQLTYARQTISQGWERSLSPLPGPVHLNCPFRDPLAPLADSLNLQQLDESAFFSAVAPPILGQVKIQQLPLDLWKQWSDNERGIIVAGPAQPQDPDKYCQAVACLSRSLNWPVLAEGLSPLRHYQAFNPYLISTYDSLLRNAANAESLIPEQVIQLGPLPTSKVLRQWLQKYQPQTWQVTPYPLNVDPLHGKTRLIESSVENLGALITSIKTTATQGFKQETVTQYCQSWLDHEQYLSPKLAHCLKETKTPFEGKISWLLPQHLPKETPVVIANSMPVRDVESFWQLNDRHIQPYFSRGANGIDGTLSTAMGIAHGYSHTLLLTGDLAFLHDTNGLLNHRYLQGSLTVIVINNQGGGIFEMLPIKDFDPPFEEYFATPQAVNIAELCAAYGIKHTLVKNWDRLIEFLQEQPPEVPSNLRVLEFRTNRKADAQWRKTKLTALGFETVRSQ